MNDLQEIKKYHDFIKVVVSKVKIDNKTSISKLAKEYKMPTTIALELQAANILKKSLPIRRGFAWILLIDESSPMIAKRVVKNVKETTRLRNEKYRKPTTPKVKLPNAKPIVNNKEEVEIKSTPIIEIDMSADFHREIKELHYKLDRAIKKTLKPQRKVGLIRTFLKWIY